MARSFLFTVAFLVVGVLFEKVNSETFELPPLPYGHSALEPYIGKETLEIHHGRHHANYVRTLNMLLDHFPELQGQSLLDVVKQSFHRDDGLFNNAAQSWNHEFYWKSMTPDYEDPSESFIEAIEKDFGSMSVFKEIFAKTANGNFGSGWAWLVYDKMQGKMIVMKTSNAGNPTAEHAYLIPLMTMDVWEHAYYLDYQNVRTTYTSDFLNNLINWKFVEENYDAVTAPTEGEL